MCFLQKAMCGYLKNLLIFYEKLVDELELYVFEMNPYDPCIENKSVDGKQLIIRWHMDDIKLSPVDKKVFLSTILCMELVYGEMHGTRGKRHGYLSMWMEYLRRGIENIQGGIPEGGPRRFPGGNNREGQDTRGHPPFLSS